MNCDTATSVFTLSVWYLTIPSIARKSEIGKLEKKNLEQKNMEDWKKKMQSLTLYDNEHHSVDLYRVFSDWNLL